MLGLEITTNHHWREFLTESDVPADVLADQFDYLDEQDSSTYFQYRGWWYHLSDFMCTGKMFFGTQWGGYASDSFFSGVLIRLAEDGERYQIATYIQRGSANV